jgi:hypothetical protein
MKASKNTQHKTTAQETNVAKRKNKRDNRYTSDELMARMKFIIGISLSFTLTGIVFVVLYSLIFVTQPFGEQSPNDAEFFKLITPIATFLTGILSGIMLGNDGKKKEEESDSYQTEVESQSQYEEYTDELSELHTEEDQKQ